MTHRYRWEIDGLRAIAIGFIILYNAKITILGHQPFKGGFIGIDIFFVISGYLITSIILKELVTTGSFSFKHFYEQRIRRIFPALLLVMLVSFPFAWMYLMTNNFISYANSIITSLSFSSNFFYHYSANTFGQVGALHKPFLHTWSLSVLGQYYILFPIILITTFRYLRKYIIHILILGFIVSLGIAELGSRNDPSATFFFIHTRIWELMAGSILAYFEIEKSSKNRLKDNNNFLSFLGLLLIFLSFFIFYYFDNLNHPSFVTLIPVIGVCLVIHYSTKDTIVKKILSIKILNIAGLVSYSLYLWHYPLFAFIRTSGIVTGNITKKILLMVVLVLLSVLSYYFVEKKFRNKNLNFKKVLMVLSSVGLIVLITNFLIIFNKGYPDRFTNLKNINENYVADNFHLSKLRIPEESTQKKEFDRNKMKVLIIGDSHGEDLHNAFFLNKEKFDKYDFAYLPFSDTRNANEENEKRKKTNIFLQSDVLVFSFRWNENKIDIISEYIEKIENKKIVIISSTNEYKVHSTAYTLLDKKVLFEKEKFDYYGLKKLYFENRLLHSNSAINKKLKNFSKSNKFLFLNREDFMCDIVDKECEYVDKSGNKIFFDYAHYTRQGAKYFGEKIHKINWFKLD